MHSTNLSSTRVDQPPAVGVVIGGDPSTDGWLYEELRAIIRAAGCVEMFWPTLALATANLTSDCPAAGLIVDTQLRGWKVLATGQAASSLALPTLVICNRTNELPEVSAMLQGVGHVKLIADKQSSTSSTIGTFVASHVAGRPQRCPDLPPVANAPVPAQEIFIIHAVAAAAQTSRVVNRLRALHTYPVQISAEAPLGGILDKIQGHGNVKLAIAVVTGDELCGPANQRRKIRRPRPNVLLEIGFFLGRLGRDRIALVVEPDVELPSDISNLHRTTLDCSDAELTIELKRALDKAGVANRM